MNPIRAMIAEDEDLLAQMLRASLQRAWPELQIVATVTDGELAVRGALEHQPDILFLDINMPVQSGLDAARDILDRWPPRQAMPLIVFVTAYDQYALQAFEREAVDYLLKPFDTARLQQMVDRLQRLLRERRPVSVETAPSSEAEAVVARMRRLLDAVEGKPPGPPLAVLQSWVGNTMTVIPIDDVLYFDASDKYIRVITPAREHLIRTSLRELLPQLPPERFWQIHRSTVVRADAITTVTRDDIGKLHLSVRGRVEKLPVSRQYAHRFKAN